ncbi:hypothetical protein CRYUN_Cryun24cG0058200 [Craigia yunnanensis]
MNLRPAIVGYESALKKFFENVLQAFLKHVDFNVVHCAAIASPGFTKDQFHRHLLLEAERRQLRPIIENKSRIILVHTSSRYKSEFYLITGLNVNLMIDDFKHSFVPFAIGWNWNADEDILLLEVAAYGLPIIATKNGGPVDIHRVLDNGLLVDPHDQ